MNLTEQEFLQILKTRFEKNMHRHKGIAWAAVQAKLEAHPEKLTILWRMEDTEGEPDVVGYEAETGEYLFFDCSPESPKGRRSLCYDPDAWESRKAHKPENSALGMADEMGIELLNEAQYLQLQQLGKFDTKTSSGIATPADIRKPGGALFGDWRYGRVFFYHNGADSYYAGRGFRGLLRV